MWNLWFEAAGQIRVQDDVTRVDPNRWSVRTASRLVSRIGMPSSPGAGCPRAVGERPSVCARRLVGRGRGIVPTD